MPRDPLTHLFPLLLVLIPFSRAVGPNLHGIFGRQSGQVESFSYTEANKKAAIHWSQDTLFDYVRPSLLSFSRSQLTLSPLHSSRTPRSTSPEPRWPSLA